MPTIDRKKLLFPLLILLMVVTACSAPPFSDPEEVIPIAADVIVMPTRVINDESVTTLPVSATDVPVDALPTNTAVATDSTTPTSNSDLAPTATSTACTPNSLWPRYTVQAGDTLFAIAQATESTVSDLQTANCLTDTLLQVNQELAVPQLPPAEPQPFETTFSISPVLGAEEGAGLEAVLLEPGQTVTIEWSPEQGWPETAAQGNQLEFFYQPVSGFTTSLAIYENIPAEAVTLSWTAPEEVLGSISATFRWSGGENNIHTDAILFAATAPNSCYFAPFGIGGGVGIYSAADSNSTVIGETIAGELRPAVGQGGRWEISQTGESGVYYLIEFSGGEGWVHSYRGSLVGTSCDQLPQINVETPVATCERAWFFDTAPAADAPCPLAPLESWMVVQSFERGTMFLLQETDTFYILADTPLSAAATNTNYPLMTVGEFTLVSNTMDEYTAPEGFYTAEMGFGFVWRGDTSANVGDLVTRLGWATAKLDGYVSTFQCDDAPPSGGQTWQSCYFSGPNGEIIQILPASYEQWRLVSR